MTQQQLAEQFLLKFLEQATALQQGPDREVALCALIQAADMLKDRFERELAELRQEGD